MNNASDNKPGTPRSAADAAALERFNNTMAIPLVLSAVLPLILLPSGKHSTLAMGVNIAAWLVFVVDLVVLERYRRHYLRSWVGRFDLAVVILTAPWFIVLGPSDSKFVLLIRLARVARLFMAAKGVRRLFAQLGRVVIVSGSVLVLCSLVAYRAEHPTNAGFATVGDAFWWGIVTLTTVGYGDIVPHTTAGRFAGVVIMLTGIATLGVLAGSLASFFGIGSKPAPENEPGTQPANAQIDALTEQVRLLTVQVAQLARGGEQQHT